MAELGELRNLGIVAHIDAGKTTVSERMLYYTGVERRMGEVHEGTATLDWMEEERQRGITITAAATTVPWRGKTINLIDTPGHVDFTVEVERCMRVLDGAVLVLNGVGGVQAQSETVWRQMMRHGVRSLAFVNQLDRPGADFFQCIEDLKTRLEAPAVPIQYPLGTGREFRAVCDLVTGQAFEFPEAELGRDPRPIDLPPEAEDEVGVLRSELFEALAEDDEELMAVFLDEREPEPEALRAALRRRVLAGTLVPVLCGAALRNVGVQLLLDAIVDYLPDPAEVPPIVGTELKTEERVEVRPEEDGPLVAFAFKLVADPNEDLLFTRVYSGCLRPGQKVYNPRLGRMERIARVLLMHADARQPVEVAGPGSIVALSGCKRTITGDTLGEHEGALVLEQLEFPEPVIEMVVEPSATGDRDKLRAALGRLAFEDPSFRVREDEDTGQWLIAGMGELHLEIKEQRLAREFGLEVRVGKPRVAYREAPVKKGVGKATVDKVLGGTRVFGAVELLLEPQSAAGDLYLDAHRPAELSFGPECAVPEAFRAALLDSLRSALDVGPRFGFPLSGARVTVVGGDSAPERDTELGFLQAGAQALRAAFSAAEVALFEPLMQFEIEAPAEFMSGILGELNARQAEIADLSVDEGTRKVVGTVPLVLMFGYASLLRSLSQGRASFSLSPAGFRRVPEEELEGRGLSWR